MSYFRCSLAPFLPLGTKKNRTTNKPCTAGANNHSPANAFQSPGNQSIRFSNAGHSFSDN